VRQTYIRFLELLDLFRARGLDGLFFAESLATMGGCVNVQCSCGVDKRNGLSSSCGNVASAVGVVSGGAIVVIRSQRAEHAHNEGRLL
jgi:hypothetical protein